MRICLFAFLLVWLGCHDARSMEVSSLSPVPEDRKPITGRVSFPEDSWPAFLQNLSVIDSPVVDYRGEKVRNQWKSAGILRYDVGNRDLQQCADALIRLRAEYLFARKRYSEIGFHFVSGDYYRFEEYISGRRPVASGNGVRFVQGAAAAKDHASLRRYLDLVYTYASTISLARKLKKADSLEVGTIVVYAGSPGHCFIIIDEARDGDGKKVFRLAEGYSPAQSIYVLRNPGSLEKSPWQRLPKGTIETASYTFTSYELRKFE